MSSSKMLPQASRRNVVPQNQTAEVTEGKSASTDLLQAPVPKKSKKATEKSRKRILLTGINSLVGHSLF